MIAGESVSAVLVDVTPYTFGTSIFGELDGMPHPAVYAPIIKKNTSIPVTRSEVYFTMYENQEAVDVNIFQGEELDATKNLPIGQFLVEGLSKAPANSPIVLELALDNDGILNVTAVEKNTGLKKSITIENAFSKMDSAEMQISKDRIDTLFGPSGDTPEQAEIVEDENVVKAKTLVEKAQGALDQATIDDRDEILALINNINSAIESGDTDALTGSTEELSEILYYLD